MDSISNGPKVPDVEMAGLRHCTLRLYGDGVSALATDPAESAVRPSRVWVTWVAKLADMILEPGPLGESEVQAIATKLAHHLPAK